MAGEVGSMDKLYVVEERLAKPTGMPWHLFFGPVPEETARATRRIAAENASWYRYRVVQYVEPETDMQEAVATSSRGQD